MITKNEEDLLIDKVLSGDERSYGELVDAYKSFAYTIAFKVVENRAEAEEVAQDSFIKAFHYLKTFNRQARFSTWLYRIVFNTAITYKRKNRQSFEDIEGKAIEHGESADAELERGDKLAFVEKAMKRLNEADQLAIQLFYIKEFSLEEVAGIMGQNINTVKVRIHRARQRMADELKQLLKKEALTL